MTVESVLELLGEVAALRRHLDNERGGAGVEREGRYPAGAPRAHQ